LSGADRSVWHAHEERAGELVVEKQLLTDDHVALQEWRHRLAAEPPDRIGSALMLIVRMLNTRRDGDGWRLREPVAALLRKRFEVSDPDAVLAARTASRALSGWNGLVATRIAEVMLRQRFGPTIVDEAGLAMTRQLIDTLADRRELGADGSTLRARLQTLLPSDTDGPPDMSMIIQADGWAADVVPRLGDGCVDGSAGPAATTRLLRQLATATGSKPAKAWSADTATLLDDPAARAVLRVLLERLAEAEPVPSDQVVPGSRIDLLLDDRNADLVRAAVWATVPLAEPWVVPTLLAVALRAFNWRTGWIASPKVANAAILALGRIGGPDGVAALSTLDARTSDNGYRKRIAAAIAAAGPALGLSPGQVLERMVDTGGLGGDGTVEFVRATATGRATLTADLSVTITWRDGTGWVAKPSADAADADINAIKRQVRELRGVVAAERRRVEGLFAEDRGWDVAEWRKYYLHHPITGRIAARLLWRFGDRTCLGSAADLPTSGEVRLWHPAGATTDEVATWRDWLLEHDLRQPFKQAYREIYLLTDAERDTRIYSNRFAAHVLHYGQAYALFKERGWVANYLGPYDGGYEGNARREFRDAAITAVFEHFPVDQDGTGPPQLCTTDRVWFHRGGDRAHTAIPLAEVPPLVFSEAMRDVDLFVGVASIALDPNWADRGDDPHYEYWERVSFGELTARARVRRDVLSRILPKLAVADRIELGDRFVRVRGKLATYKIHLGSANIMIDPDDRYLCIVPSPRRGRTAMMLPFDGDEVLTVILSKVVLLAADDKIKDPTILNQIPR
jgi:hypothetical protein